MRVLTRTAHFADGGAAGRADRLRPSAGWRRAGLFLSALPVLFLIVDSAGKLARIPPVLESFAALGYPAHLARGIGFLELACLAVYLSPRTGALGAVLLTGYLGGAVATHVRIGSPVATHVLFPIYIAVMLWAGLALRDRRVRAWLPVRIRG